MEYSKVKSKSETSICKKSIKFLSNIIRVSSFSFANKTLRKPARDSAFSEREIAIDEPLLPETSAGRRLQESRSQSNPTYVIKPVARNIESTSRVKLHNENTQIKPTKEDSVDGLASEYIQRIRKRLGCDLLEPGKHTT